MEKMYLNSFNIIQETENYLKKFKLATDSNNDLCYVVIHVEM